jgi:hypothetical protein
VENLKGVSRSRERMAAFREVKTLGRRQSGQLAAVLPKRVRGWSLHFDGGGRLAKQETPKGRKPKGASAGAVQLTPAPPGGISLVCEALKERERSEMLTNSKRDAAFERAHGTTRGSKASQGEPHERNRDEISPAGREGSKASRG